MKKKIRKKKSDVSTLLLDYTIYHHVAIDHHIAIDQHVDTHTEGRLRHRPTQRRFTNSFSRRRHSPYLSSPPLCPPVPSSITIDSTYPSYSFFDSWCTDLNVGNSSCWIFVTSRITLRYSLYISVILFCCPCVSHGVTDRLRWRYGDGVTVSCIIPWTRSRRS